MCSYRSCSSKAVRVAIVFSGAAPGSNLRKHFCSVLHAVGGLLDMLKEWGGESTQRNTEQERLRMEAVQAVEDLAQMKAEGR